MVLTTRKKIFLYEGIKELLYIQWLVRKCWEGWRKICHRIENKGLILL